MAAPVPEPPTNDLDTRDTLDELYWHTDLSTTEVGRRTGQAPGRLHRRVTPLPAGVDCWWCATALTYTSRTSRTEPRLRCGSCGATRRNPTQSPVVTATAGPAPVGGVIVVRPEVRLSMHDRWDPGRDIDACIDALASAGKAWDPQRLVVVSSAFGDGRDVVALLAGHEPDVVAVRDLRVLADTQTERLQVLYELTRRRWRVIAAHDIDGRTREIRSRHLEHLDDAYDDRDPASMSWSDHLVHETSDERRAENWWRW